MHARNLAGLVLMIWFGSAAFPQAVLTGSYRNLFSELLGKSQAEVQAKLDAAWQQLFYGDDATERVYYPVGSDMAYIMDIGSDDVRTEGMSYGMMVAVQMDKKAEFDRIWKWAKTYMFQQSGSYQGYFAWHCTKEGRKLNGNPASDGEEWFATALFFRLWPMGRWRWHLRVQEGSAGHPRHHAPHRGPRAEPRRDEHVRCPSQGGRLRPSQEQRRSDHRPFLSPSALLRDLGPLGR